MDFLLDPLKFALHGLKRALRHEISRVSLSETLAAIASLVNQFDNFRL
jgi:hypothetical protein